jgi:hypothetical protein
MKLTKAERIARRLSWRQCVMLDWVARGSIYRNEPRMAGRSITVGSLWRRGLLGRYDGRSLTRLGFKVIIILRRGYKV